MRKKNRDSNGAGPSGTRTKEEKTVEFIGGRDSSQNEASGMKYAS